MLIALGDQALLDSADYQRLLDVEYCNAIASDPVILEIFFKIYLAGFIDLLEKNKRS